MISLCPTKASRSQNHWDSVSSLYLYIAWAPGGGGDNWHMEIFSSLLSRSQEESGSQADLLPEADPLQVFRWQQHSSGDARCQLPWRLLRKSEGCQPMALHHSHGTRASRGIKTDSDMHSESDSVEQPNFTLSALFSCYSYSVFYVNILTSLIYSWGNFNFFDICVSAN